jgi:H+/Cl- antiporter ClcA
MRLGAQLRALLEWIGLGAVVGVVCGASSALFLWLLDLATQTRTADERLIYALPIAGLAIGWAYARLGASIRGGNNLILDTVHDGGPQVPLRMAPMVLIGTVLTHLFGGSAGREGTAVQMGGSLADAIVHLLRAPRLRRALLAAGIAGGFGSVFGTPVAGTVFGLEVVVIGALEYDALVPALVAAVVGDATTRGLGIVHTAYPQVAAVALSPRVLLAWLGLAVASALCALAFIEATHGLKRLGERHVPRAPLRLALGGAAVLGLWQLVGSDYLGLGIPTILRAFVDPALPAWAFAAKLALTVITLGAGFLGGEVTPLFFIGATLGNVVARVAGVPIELGAAVGMAALFAAASNTPLALSIMAVELVGGAVLPHVVIVAVLAYLLTGPRSIYPAQRLRRHKAGAPLPAPTALRDLDPPP